MRKTVHGRKSLTRQWCDGQLHRPPNYRTTRDPNGTPKTTDPTHQRQWNNQRSRLNRTILRNDHSKQTPETCYTFLQNEPRGRPNNIRLPMATNLQPTNQLGEGGGHNALAKSMDQKEYHHRCRRTNTGGVPLTCQGIRRKRSRQVPPKMRRRPCDQPKGRRPSSPRLQNLPTIP